MQRLGKRLAIWGAVLQLGVVGGLATTVVMMIRTSADLSRSTGPVTPEDLSSGISTALVATAVGSAASLVGFILILIAVLGCKYREPWLHSVMWVLAVLWLFVFMPLGISMMVGLTVAGRRAFRPREWSQDGVSVAN